MTTAFARLRALALRAWLLALLLIPVVADGATATRAWCRTDPMVRIKGDLADVFVAGPLKAPLRVTGPNEIVVTVPNGVKATLVLNDLGFGRGNTVTFKRSSRLRATRNGVEVRIDVRVPATDGDMPVRVEFAPRVVGVLSPASAEGTANEWITLRTTF